MLYTEMEFIACSHTFGVLVKVYWYVCSCIVHIHVHVFNEMRRKKQTNKQGKATQHTQMYVI